MPPKDEQLAALASLNEPMRRRLYEFVAQQEGTVSRDDVVSALGIARSVVAFHLDKLVDLGLLDVEFRRPEGRRGPGAGRPAKFYRRAAAEIAMSVPDRHYDIAALLLARALEMAEDRSISATTALRAVARDYGHSISSGVERPDGSVSASLENVCSLLARHGYRAAARGTSRRARQLSLPCAGRGAPGIGLWDESRAHPGCRASGGITRCGGASRSQAWAVLRDLGQSIAGNRQGRVTGRIRRPGHSWEPRPRPADRPRPRGCPGQARPRRPGAPSHRAAW